MKKQFTTSNEKVAQHHNWMIMQLNSPTYIKSHAGFDRDFFVIRFKRYELKA